MTALILGIAFTGAGAATAVLVGSGNPTGQWATPSVVQGVIQSEKLVVGKCSGGVCKIGLPAHRPDVVQTGPQADVLSATVAGIGPYKLINGVRHYRLFDVRACTVYYYRGAHRFGVHFRWYTHRPPSITTTTNRDGTVSAGQDSGEPYARDWNYPRFAPLAHDHC